MNFCPWRGTSAPESQWKLIIIKAFIFRALHCLYSAKGVYRGVLCALAQTQMKHFTNLCMCFSHENNNWAQRTTGRRGGWDCASRSRGPSRFVPEHSRFTLFLSATKIAKSRAGNGRQLNVKIERVQLSQLAFFLSVNWRVISLLLCFVLRVRRKSGRNKFCTYQAYVNVKYLSMTSLLGL